MYVPLDDDSLISTFAHRGPFVTVYLDMTRSAGGGMDEIDQRWATVVDTLEDADPETVGAIEECLTIEPGDLMPHGLVVVAAEGELCMTRRTPSAPERSAGFHSPLPNLLPYLANTMPEVANLVVIADPLAPCVVQAVGTELRPLWRAPVPGSAEDGPSMRRVVARLASQHNPELVVVAGRDQSATNTLDLVHSAVVDTVTVRAASVDVADSAALHVCVDAVLRAYVKPARTELLALLRSRVAARSRNDAVSGLRDVVAALRMAQVDTVVVADRPELAGQCWIGTRPTEFGLSDADARDVGVRTIQHDRVGAALVRAIVATGARLLIAEPSEVKYPQGIAALLR